MKYCKYDEPGDCKNCYKVKKCVRHHEKHLKRKMLKQYRKKKNEHIEKKQPDNTMKRIDKMIDYVNRKNKNGNGNGNGWKTEVLK